MKNKQMIIWTLLVLMTLISWGCGSSRDSSGTTTGSSEDGLANAETVGITNCTTCHSVNTSSQTFVWLYDQLTDPTSPAYPVTEPNPHSTSGTSLKDSDSSCAPCHNQFQDGQRMPAAFFAEGLTASAERNVVGCESCHGGGQYHFGNPAGVPFPKPGDDQCAGCHEGKHGLTVASEYVDNAHANSLNSHVYDSADPTLVRARCSKCHSSEGARLYKGVAGDHDQLVTAFTDVASLADATSVSCRTCHTPHAEAILLLDTDEVFTASSQYNTCTNCHQLTYPSADATTPNGWMQDAYHAPPVNSYGDYGEIISDSHYDDPATVSTLIEGYVIKSTTTGACADCHSPHSSDLTINRQWARSGHAGKILDEKEAAEAAAGDVFAAAVDSSTGDAWVHYDWDNTLNASPFFTAGECQKCHTSTGIMNYLDNPGGYAADGSGNDFSHLSGWSNATGSPQQELLYCWGCHDNFNDTERVNVTFGALRAQVGTTTDYDYPAATPVVLPDVVNSNACTVCHAGRGNVTTMLDPVNRSSRFAGHHAPAAGTLFSADTHLGYEYAGLDYTDKSYFRHSRIGTDVTGDPDETSFADAIAVTGIEAGPCVSCHMPDSNHTFTVVEKDATGAVTAIPNQALCDACHSSHGFMTPEVIEEESAGYQDSSALLNAYVDNTITNYLNLPIDETATLADDYGAFQNAKLATEEPGGFAHNRYYAKRLIFDAIDQLDGDNWDTTGATPVVGTDGNNLDGIINFDTAAYPYAGQWLGAADADDPTAMPPVLIGDANRP